MSASTVDKGIAPLQEFDRVESDGEEYLVHDVVAQKEGVYTYPDPEGGVRREFAPADELIGAIEDVEEVQTLLRHPRTPDGSLSMTADPRANYKEVGDWLDIRPTDGDDGIAGKVFIRANEIGDHGGDLREYINKVERHGVGEVSTGYDIQRAEASPGRYNGMEYNYIQRGHELDHLALLVDEQGDCSVEDGCGLGRANNLEESKIRLNHHYPDAADDAEKQTPEGVSAEDIGKAVLSRLGSLGLLERSNQSISVHEPSWSGKTETKWSAPDMEDFDTDDLSDIADHFLVSKSGFPPDNFSDLSLPVVEPDGELNLNGVESALQMAGQVEGLSGDDLDRAKSILNGLMPDDRENMNDEERINQLVEEHGFTRENIRQLSGTTCLKRFHESVVENGGTQDNMGDNGSDNGGDGGDDDIFTEEQIDRLNEIVAETVQDQTEELAEEISDEIEVPTPEDVDEEEIVKQTVEQVEKTQEHRENIEAVAASDEYPLGKEELERMNEEVVADLAEDLDDDEGGSGDPRANFAGRPGGGSFDETEYEGEDGYDIPAPGEGFMEDSE